MNNAIRTTLCTITAAVFVFLLVTAAFSTPDAIVYAQDGGPAAATGDSSEASFPWLAVLLFIGVSGLLTWFRAHPKYPKKPTGNTCAPVIEEGKRPFQIQDD